MRERDPGNTPSINDRYLMYIFIKKKKEKKYTIDMVENPDYIIQNNIEIDYRFYVTNQLMKPILQIFELTMKNPKILFDTPLRILIIKKVDKQN